MSEEKKSKYYISMILVFTGIISMLISLSLKTNVLCKIISFLILLIPTSEYVIQIFQYILSKFVKPKLIPKMDFENGIDEENATMVVIPTI